MYIAILMFPLSFHNTNSYLGNNFWSTYNTLKNYRSLHDTTTHNLAWELIDILYNRTVVPGFLKLDIFTMLSNLSLM